jgi:hypothetical protein
VSHLPEATSRLENQRETMSSTHFPSERVCTRSALLRAGGAIVLVAGFAFAGAPAAHAASATPDATRSFASPTGSGVACSKAAPCSISQAVTAATPGTRILLADGTYDAQLTVTQSNVTIVGATYLHEPTVIIRPTAVTANATEADGTPVDAIIGVKPGLSGVTISNVTIDGSQANLPACTGTSFAGVAFHNSSGSVTRAHITHMQPAGGITSCAVGDGIYVGSQSGTSHVHIGRVMLDTYNQNGVNCTGVGTVCTITSTRAYGTPNALIAQTGIHITSGAGGSIAIVSIQHNVDTAGCQCGAAILINRAAAGISITHATLRSSNSNLYAAGGGGVGQDTLGLTVSHTTSNDAVRGDGLSLDSVDGASVTSSVFSANGEFGIGIFGATNASISGVDTTKNGMAGIYLNGSGSTSSAATGNTVSGSTEFKNHAPGIWAAHGATGNTFSDNSMSKNSPDARDDTGVGMNTWSGNTCTTSTPATGLCQ